MTEQNIFNKTQSNSPFSLGIKKEDFVPLVAEKSKVQTKTINDFDSSLILEKINKTITNKAVKLGMKISTLQKEMKLIDEKIDLLKLLNLESDKKQLNNLQVLRDNIAASLDKLLEEQKKKGFFYYLYSFFDEKFNISKFNTYFDKIFPDGIKNFQNEVLKLLTNLLNSIKGNLNNKQL